MNPNNPDNSGVPQDVLEAFGQKQSKVNGDVPQEVLDAFNAPQKKKDDLLSGQRPSSYPLKSGTPQSALPSNPLFQSPEKKVFNLGFDLRDNKVPENVKAYNNAFEAATGYQDFNLSTPAKAKSNNLLGNDFNESKRNEVEAKKFNQYQQAEKDISAAQQKIHFGAITPDELQEAVTNPISKNIISKEVAPFITNPDEDIDYTKLSKDIYVANRGNAASAQKVDLDQKATEISAGLKEVAPDVNVDFDNSESVSNALQEVKNKYRDALSLIDIQKKIPYEERRHLPEIQGLDGIINKSAPLIEQLQSRLAYNQSLLPISNSLKDVDTKIDDAVISNLNTDYQKGSDEKVSDDATKQQQFKLGLSFFEKADPGFFNAVTNTLRQTGKVAPTDFYSISSMGQSIYNQKVYTDPAGISAESYPTVTNFDYTTREQRKSDIAATIGEQLKQDKGGVGKYLTLEGLTPSVGVGKYLTIVGALPLLSYSEDEIRNAAKQTGIDPDSDIVKELIVEEHLFGYNAIPKSGYINQTIAGAMPVLKPTVNFVSNLINSAIGRGETAGETYLRSKSLSDLSSPGQKVSNSEGEITDVLPSERTVSTDIFQGLGQFIAQLPATLAFGGALGGAAKGAASVFGKTIGVNAARGIADYGGTYLSMLAQSYNQTYEQYLQSTGDENVAKKAAFMDANIQALTEMPLLDIQIARKGLSGLRQGLTNDLQGLVKNGGDVSTLMKEARTPVKKFLDEYVKMVSTEIGESEAGEIGSYVTQQIFDPNAKKDENTTVLSDAWDVAKSTALSMALPALFGAGGSAFQRDFTQKSLHHAAVNYDDYKVALQNSVDKKEISQNDFNKSLQLLNTHRESLQSVPELDANGNRVKLQAGLDYGLETTKIKYFKEKQEQAKTNPEKELYDSKIKASEDIQRQILSPKIETPEVQKDETTETKSEVPIPSEETGTANKSVSEVSQGTEEGSFEDKVRSLYPALKKSSDAEVNDFVKVNATDSPSKFIKEFGEGKFNEVVKDIPLKELKSKQEMVEKYTPESEDVGIFNKIISEREKEGDVSTAIQDSDLRGNGVSAFNGSAITAKELGISNAEAEAIHQDGMNDVLSIINKGMKEGKSANEINGEITYIFTTGGKLQFFPSNKVGVIKDIVRQKLSDLPSVLEEVNLVDKEIFSLRENDGSINDPSDIKKFRELRGKKSELLADAGVNDVKHLIEVIGESTAIENPLKEKEVSTTTPIEGKEKQLSLKSIKPEYKVGNETFNESSVHDESGNKIGEVNVQSDKKGNIVRNVFLEDNAKNQGYGKSLYRDLNKNSIEETGNPLRSSNADRELKSGEKLRTRTDDANRLWNSLVKSGEAEKLNDNTYRFKKEQGSTSSTVSENNPALKDIEYAKHDDGTLKVKSEYTPEEWTKYTKSVIDAKLSESNAKKSESIIEDKQSSKKEPIDNKQGKQSIPLKDEAKVQGTSDYQKANKELEDLKEKHSKYFKKDGGLRANVAESVKSELKQAYDKFQETINAERERRVEADKRDTGLVDGIDNVRDNQTAFALVRMAIDKGVIPDRQFNDFGKNLANIVSTDSHGKLMETADIIRDFSDRKYIKNDEQLRAKLQAADNAKFEEVPNSAHPEVKTDVKTVIDELKLDSTDEAVYNELKDVKPENRENALEDLADSYDNKIDKNEEDLRRVENEIDDNGREIDTINDSEDMTDKQKKSAIKKLDKRFDDLQTQEKELEAKSESLKKEQHSIRYYDVEDANNIINKIDARLATRKNVKAGTDLFPEDANIPEFVAIKKELKTQTDDNTIQHFEQRTADEVKQLEPTIKNIESKAESENEVDLNEAIKKADELISEAQPETELKTSTVIGSDVGKQQAKVIPKKEIGRFEKAARERAAKLEDKKYDFLFGNQDPNIKKSGVDIDLRKALQKSIIEVGKLMDKGVEISDAIKQITKDFIDDIKGIHGVEKLDPKYEDALRNGFEREAKSNLEDVMGEDNSGRTGISNAATRAVREKYGLGKREIQSVPDSELSRLADEAIAKGYNPETVIEQMEDGIPPTAVENFIFKKYLATLQAKFEKSHDKNDLAKIERVVKAFEGIGTLQSGAFRTRGGMVDIDDSLAGFFISEKELNKNAPLTENQEKTVEKEYKEITDSQKDYEDKIAKLEAENKRLKARKNVAEIRPKAKKTNKTHEDYVNERASLREQLKKEVEKFKSEGQKMGITSDGGVESFKITAKMAKVVGEIAKSHLNETAMKFNDLIDNVFEDVKDIMSGIKKSDIIDIMAGDYTEKRPTRSQLSARMRDIKTEAGLIKKYEALLRGEEPKTESGRIKRNQAIEDLRTKINEIQKRVKAENKITEDTVEKENIPDEIKKLRALTTKLEKEEKSIRDNIEAGNFETPKKSTPLLEDAELKKNFPEEYKKAILAKDRLIKAKNDRKLRFLLQQQQNMSKYERNMKGAAELANIPRSLMTMLDYSAVLRQALIPTISHPLMAAKAGVEMVKSGFSQKQYDRWFYDLENSNADRYNLMQLSNLALTDANNPKLIAHEEAFMSNLAEKIPLIGKSLKVNGKTIVPGADLVKGSERAYTMYLNKMRVDLFNRFADAMEERGLTWENGPKQYKQMAAYVNNSTGRGDLWAKLDSVAPLLNGLFFSPRLIASRLNMMTYLMQLRFYKAVPREVRVAYFKDMVKTIGLGMTVLGLFSLNKDDDTTVESDPRSSDFGKIRNGNTRWDIWAGYQQYIRLLAQIYYGERKSTTGKMYTLDGEGAFGQTRGDVLMSFVRGKSSPLTGMAIDLLSGRTMVGEKIKFQTGEEGYKEINAGRYFMEHLVPLNATGLRDALKDQGMKAWITVGVPSTFGVGTQTFDNKKRPKKRGSGSSSKF